MKSSVSSSNCISLTKYYAAFFIACLVLSLLYLESIPGSSRDHSYICNRGNLRSTSGEFLDSDSFIESMKQIPWHAFETVIEKNDLQQIRRHSNYLFSKLYPFLLKSPPVPVNETCVAPQLRISEVVSSSDNCTKLKEPRKVGVLLQFGFEVDALEVHLHELDAVVDKFFIVESTLPHSPFLLNKPLVWEALKYDDRFVRFLPKIVHFVVDDAASSTNNGSSNEEFWKVEALQEKIRWTKFLEWNENSKFFSSGDILGFGDADEIPNRNNIFIMKHCQIPTDPVDVGIWFRFPFIDSIFATDWPVKNHPFTLGDPTFWTVDTATKYYNERGLYPTRMRGKSPAFILGGLHMSKYPYPPYQMIKLLTASESGLTNLKNIVEIGLLYSENRRKLAEVLLNYNYPYYIKKRTKKISSLRSSERNEADVIANLPWFIQCNPERYPNLRDTRLDFRLLR